MNTNKKDKKKRIKVISGTIIAVLCICIASYVYIKGAGKSSESQTPLREYTVQRGDITAGVTGSGTISFDTDAQNFSEPVRIREYFVDKGARVKKGDKIAAADLDWLQERVDEASAELEKAANMLLQAENAKTVSALNQKKEEAGASSAIAGAQSAVDQAQQEVDSVRRQIDGVDIQINEIDAQLAALPGDDAGAENSQDLPNIPEEATYVQVNPLEDSVQTQTPPDIPEEAVLMQQAALEEAGPGSPDNEPEQPDNEPKQSDNEQERRSNEPEQTDAGSESPDNEPEQQDSEPEQQDTNPEQPDTSQESPGASDDQRNALEARRAALNAQRKELQAQLEDAQASLNAAISAKEQEAQQYYKTSGIDKQIAAASQKDLDATVSSAKIDVDMAQKKLDRLKALAQDPNLYASRDGVLLEQGYTPGQETTADIAVAQVGDPSKITAQFSIPQTDIGKITEGQDVELTLDAFGDRKFTGTVVGRTLVPIKDSSSVSYLVNVSVDPEDAELLTGMTANAQFIIKQVKNVLKLSNKAIFVEDGKQYVRMQNEDKTLRKVEIETGFSDGKTSEITGGLSENDIVVVER